MREYWRSSSWVLIRLIFFHWIWLYLIDGFLYIWLSVHFQSSKHWISLWIDLFSNLLNRINQMNFFIWARHSFRWNEWWWSASVSDFHSFFESFHINKINCNDEDQSLVCCLLFFFISIHSNRWIERKWFDIDQGYFYIRRFSCLIAPDGHSSFPSLRLFFFLLPFNSSLDHV